MRIYVAIITVYICLFLYDVRDDFCDDLLWKLGHVILCSWSDPLFS